MLFDFLNKPIKISKKNKGVMSGYFSSPCQSKNRIDEFNAYNLRNLANEKIVESIEKLLDDSCIIDFINRAERLIESRATQGKYSADLEWTYPEKYNNPNVIHKGIRVITEYFEQRGFKVTYDQWDSTNSVDFTIYWK